MKIMKRIAALLLTVALMVPCFSNVVLAADGVIFFSDLETSVGATFTITGTVVNRTGSLGDVSVQMSYDTSYMQFMSGDGVNADSEGNLTYTGTASGDTLEFTMEFQALQEGSTRMEQGTATVTTADGTALECDSGYADITIGPGDPSLITTAPTGTAEVTVNGQGYSLSGDFTDTQMPQGFARGEFTYNEGTYAGAVQESAGVTLAYLVDAAGDGDFWVYNSEDSSFSPCEEIMISDTYSLVLMDGRSAVSLPSSYTESAVEISGKEIPAWLSPDREGFSVLYGVNSDGDASLYLYDSLEHTYQRMDTPSSGSEGSSDSSGLWGKISGFITEHLLWVVVGAGCLVVIMLVFLLVLAVKLARRNRELDDLYEELDAEEEQPSARKSSRSQFLRSQDEDDLDDDYYDDDDEYYDDDDDDYYEDDYEDDDLEDLRNEFQQSRQSSGHQFDEYYDDDDFEEDIPVTPEIRGGRKRKNDTFEMDFIDLDE